MSSDKNLQNKLWVSKYRPQHIADIIFQNDIHEKFFTEIVDGKRELPSLLLSGIQGTGKTTVSLALINDLNIHSADVMLVKCSDETGVDNLRDRVSRFAETMPLGNYKVIRMEECDMLSQSAQGVLRHIVEDNIDSCRFIFTCNYVNKIMPALKSRLQRFEFKAPNQEDIIVKMADMLDQEGVSLETEEDIIALEKIVSVTYPDIRSTIQTLQQHVSNKKLVWSNSSSNELDVNDYKFKLLDLLETGNFDTARKLACENAQREEYDDLFRFIYQNIHRVPRFKDIEMQKKAIVIIGDYIYRHAFITHVDINLDAMFISLSNL